MTKYEKLNSILVSEASTILHDYGLLEILSKYGEPFVQGSYSLNLMTWRDLDILLKNDNLEVEGFFGLGLEIAKKLKPHRMSFRNELLSETPGLPKGLYWGVYTKNDLPETWKIDIWAVDSKQSNFFDEKFQELKSQLNEENRPILLRIKSNVCRHPEYRKKFFSMDIYIAVIENNVSSIEDFHMWLKRNKGVIIS